MTTLGQLADFAHPQPVAEPGPPLGKAYRGQLSRRQAYVGGGKLLLRPILAGIFAIGQACNASVLHLDEKIGAVTFAIKHHGKTMKQLFFLAGMRIRPARMAFCRVLSFNSSFLATSASLA